MTHNGWQAAALAEFRADWSTAVKTYQTAYGQVQKVQLGTVLPLQHWYELTRVAEEVHIKVGWLLQPCMYASRGWRRDQGWVLGGGGVWCFRGVNRGVEEGSLLLKTYLQSTCSPFGPDLLPSAVEWFA